MKRQTLVAVALLSSCFTAFAGNNHANWSYKGKQDGPSAWSELDPAFKECSLGKAQSPINIEKTERVDLPALQFSYSHSAAPTLINNGHTVQVNLPAGNTLQVGDKTYELLQFHFHTPSEETIHGKHLPMVAHFVHKNAEGQLGVVGLLIKQGKTNHAFDPIFAHTPRAGEKITVDNLTVDLDDMLPAKLGYYAFEGSLTTPPCSEGVNWMVVKQPITLGKEQIKAFKTLFKGNARPTQPLNGRVIKESL